MTFVHLNNKTAASMLYASCKVDELAKRAKELGQDSLALTDYANVYNAIPFYRAAQKEGIKPILGCEFFVTESNIEYRTNRNRQVAHIILLAENNIGWKNITRLITESNTGDNYYYKPRIDLDMLEKHSEGVIALTAGIDGILSMYLFDKLEEDGSIINRAAKFRADALLRKLLGIYGTDHLFLEVQNNQSKYQNEINSALRKLANKYGLRTVATNNVHYIKRSDAEAHRTLLAMAANQHNAMTWTNFESEDYFLKTREQMIGFTDEELDLTGEIADRCNVEIDLKKRRLPSYQFVPEGQTAKTYLRELCEIGFKKLGFMNVPNIKEYQDRLNRELDDINDMGFADYFLIVEDVCTWVRGQGILLGKGRGSAGGSLVSYCLGITDIDPLPYGLVWERFLNKGRGGLPDIDTDVPRSRRQEVLTYIRDRFGEGNVAQLVTFNKLGARSVLKEVFRAYDMDFELANKITSFVPLKNDDHQSVTLSEALEMSPELREYEEQYKAWFSIAKALEGCYKSIGMHAAAVVISDIPFDDSEYPLCRTKTGDLIFAYDMQAVDGLSLLKLDILGLSTLDDVSECIKIVKERRGEDIDRDNLPLDDMDTYALFYHGKTAGVFQLEKQLGKTWSKRTQPTDIDELSDLVSIIRPGPLESGMADDYVAVKSGEREATYLHPKLEPLLKKTFSGCLYQEQVIFICQQLAGMSLIDADKVRKAMGKKKPEEMAKWRDVFVDGCKNASDIEESISGEIWGFIEKFAGYGFNKAHGVGYGLLAYETAYLKANYPIEFFCAKLRNAANAPDTMEEFNKLINDAKLFDIEVTPPSVKKGNIDFDIVDDNKIAFGLTSLKGVGIKAIQPVIKKCTFTDFDEFLWSSSVNKVSKTVIIALIKSGSLDYLGLPRVDMMAQFSLFKCMSAKEVELVAKLKKDTGVSDFVRLLVGISDETKCVKIKEKYEVKLPNVKRRLKIREALVEYRGTDIFDSKPQNISWEKELLGIPLTGNLADAYRARNTCREISRAPSDARVEVALTIGGFRKAVTKRGRNPGQEMAFMEGGDHTYYIENIVIFPNQWEECQPIIEEGAVVKISGSISERGGLIANKIERLR